MNINDKKGFTLIEILIVVAIIAILASIVLVGLGPTQQSGRDARRLSDLHEVQTGLELYYNKCGGYPGGTSCAATVAAAAYSGGASSYYGGMATAVTGSGLGITVMPQDPSGGATYFYAVPSDSALNTSYVLGAKLENANNSVFLNYTAPTLPAAGDEASMGSCAKPYYCVTL